MNTAAIFFLSSLIGMMACLKAYSRSTRYKTSTEHYQGVVTTVTVEVDGLVFQNVQAHIPSIDDPQQMQFLRLTQKGDLQNALFAWAAQKAASDEGIYTITLVGMGADGVLERSSWQVYRPISWEIEEHAPQGVVTEVLMVIC